MHCPSSISDCWIPIPISSNQHFKFKAHNYTFFFTAICLVCRLSFSDYDLLGNKRRSYHIIETERKNHTYIRGIELQRLSSSNFWEKIDLTKELSCGRYKCIFRDKMNEKVGYLIHSNHRTGIQFESEALIAWEVVEYMKSNFGIKHLINILCNDCVNIYIFGRFVFNFELKITITIIMAIIILHQK